MASFEAEEGFRIGGRVLRKLSSKLAKTSAKPDRKVACACVLATGAMQAISRLWSQRAGSLAAGGRLTPSPAIWRWRGCFGRNYLLCKRLADRQVHRQVHRQLAVDLAVGLVVVVTRACPPTLRREGSGRARRVSSHGVVQAAPGGDARCPEVNPCPRNGSPALASMHG